MSIAKRLNGVLGVQWERFLEPFRVSGGRASGPSRPIVFIGESPHTDEVNSGCTPEDRHPLAGESGKIVTTALTGLGVFEDQEDEPIGALRPNWLSIINVSEVPLNPAAYLQLIAKDKVQLDTTQRPSLEQWAKMMYSFQLIKNGPVKRSRGECFVNEVETHIKNDFHCRAESEVGCNTQLVVCLGKAAELYYKPLCSEGGVTRVLNEAHPSRSHKKVWNTSEELQKEVQRIVRNSR